jgi:hypothetical protein
MHIVVFIIAVALGIATLAWYRAKGITFSSGIRSTSPALIGGTVEPSLRK